MPRVAITATMAEAVVEISAKGFGCVGVIDLRGKLAGIITDGDLRRHMCPDLMTVAVLQVMTRAPRTAARDALAVEVLEVLASSRIGALFIIDAAGRPCGIVHLHDLLRLGVA